MEKFKQIIILSNNHNLQSDNTFIINTPIILEDDTHLNMNGDIYTFDYLIFTNPSQITNFEKTSILHENMVPVTNCFCQTVFENIYYTSEETINIALQNIFENE